MKTVFTLAAAAPVALFGLAAAAPRSVLAAAPAQTVVSSKAAATARVALAQPSPNALAALGPELAGPNGQAPNYLRAFAANLPAAAPPLAHLVRTTLRGGTVSPALKIGMGLRVARLHKNEYLALHLSRVAAATPAGDVTTPAEQRALRYADALTQNIHGVSDADFAELRRYFNDSQLVELTGAVCFFNYFSRVCAGLNLPVEDWARQPAARQTNVAARSIPVTGFADIAPAGARVALISDAEAKAVAGAVAPPPPADAATNRNSLGLGFANSRRAMLRAPEFANAWFDYWAAIRPLAVTPRETLLQVSFAVSMANGCRYCTVHQIVGLRRLGVDPAKLVAMKKDDAVLTPAERAAVTFARKLTRDPAGVTNADWQALVAAHGERGALDIVLQTGNFAFMNRFTDGLRLPSEDEAVHIYQEVYGGAGAASDKQAAAAGG